MLAIGDEYGTGMIRVSLAATPRRLRLLAAKLAVLAGPVLVASAVAVAACVLAGRLILPGHGFTPAHGYDLGRAAALAAPFRMVLYLTLIAVLGLGVAAVVRDGGAAVGGGAGLLYLFPVAASLVGDRARGATLEQIGPMSAGLDAQATISLRALPLAVLAGPRGMRRWWAAGPCCSAAWPCGSATRNPRSGELRGRRRR